MSPTKVALAGATGNLGVSVLEALLGANFDVTVLSRFGGNSSKLAPHPNLKIKEVDFNSTQSLIAALTGAEIVISCLATLAIGSQNPSIDASVAAGVKRFIPAEFGMDSRHPLCAALPVCVPKGLKVGWIIKPASHTATLYNGGDVSFSATTLAHVAKAVLGVIQNQDRTANRIVYIHSAVTTQNRLIQYAKDEDGRVWHTTSKYNKEIMQESLEELAKGTQENIQAAIDGFCVCATFNADYGCDFSSHLEDDLLGVEMMSEAELRALVGGFL